MGFTRRSLKVTLSYVFDWVIIALIAGVGGLFTLIPENHRPFSLADPDISFPYIAHETISSSTLVLVGLVAPGIITLLICLVFVPGPTVSKDIPKSQIWKRKLWEWNTAWLGLGLSLALAFMLTDGLKILFGRPRPDLLARCLPDLANINEYIVGGLGSKVLQGQYLVDFHICQQTDQSILDDGFVSFPSGHSSFSWAGLGYLSLFICSKFAIAIPYLLPGQYETTAFDAALSSNMNGKDSRATAGERGEDPQLKTLRSSAAAPPVYTVVLAIIPLCAASYIVATRFTDYRHHAFDLIFGTLIGMTTAIIGFRWFHAPIRTGAGWSWGPRSAEKAFGVGVGVQSYADDSLLHTYRVPEHDLEIGQREI